MFPCFRQKQFRVAIRVHICKFLHFREPILLIFYFVELPQLHLKPIVSMRTQQLSPLLVEQYTLNLRGAADRVDWVEVAPERYCVFTRSYHLWLIKVDWCHWIFQNDRFAFGIGEVVVPNRNDFIFVRSCDQGVFMEAQVWDLAFVAVHSVDRWVLLSDVMIDDALIARTSRY